MAMTHRYATCLLRRLMLLLAALPVVLAASGQKEINNIYLFDCTASMKKQGLWEPAKQALDLTIESQRGIEGATYTIVPFGDEPYRTVSFTAGEYGAGLRDEMVKEFEADMAKASFTRISSVLRKGFGLCDPNRENKIFLLTDGMPNGGDTPERVAALISEWCESHRSTRLFYVALRQGIVNSAIRAAIDACPDAYVVECEDGVIPQIGDVSGSAHGDIEHLPAVFALRFSIPVDVPMAVECADTLFEASVEGGRARAGIIKVRIDARGGRDAGQLNEALQGLLRDRVYAFAMRLRSLDGKIRIANPEVLVQLADHVRSSVSLAAGESELAAAPASYHDGFLWSEASAPARVSFDLQPVFENVTDARAGLLLEAADSSVADYTVYFNGAPVGADNPMVVRPGAPAVVEVEFAPEAATGKRYVRLEPVAASGIDLVNGVPAADFEALSLRTTYSHPMNPLLKAMLWLGAVLAALVALWLAVLRRMFFPPIRAARMEITGPGSYYATKKIRGAYKVVLTSRRRRQSVFSRLFRGKEIIVRADHFDPAVELTAGTKKKVRLRCAAAPGGERWEFSPSAVLAPFERTEMTLPARRTKSTIEIQ